MNERQKPRVLTKKLYAELERMYAPVLTNGVVDDVVEMSLKNVSAINRIFQDLKDLDRHLAELPTVKEALGKPAAPFHTEEERAECLRRINAEIALTHPGASLQ